MLIEITEELVRHDGHEYLKGPHTVPEGIGTLFCASGWATTNVPGVELGERNTDPVELEVESASNGTASPEV